MGEVVVSSDDRMEAQVQETGEPQNLKGCPSSTTVMWERFLPKMVVRVLLVESDVSTRQIIAALLRKCSYKVAAVSDGLKAWELLKGRPHNIDLILTEVDLPSISGYALLSLIMEHDVCKNIPVIMMSSNDSVSTVYKCMLKGAADFLVKPLRKNELRNVWQHVWRKQVSSSAAGLGPPEESETQQKVEATAENNDVSNHSSGGYIQRNRDGIEKGSDAQSSCTKPEGEKEDENTNNAHCPSQAKNAKFLSDHVDILGVEELRQDSRTTITQNNEPDGSQPEPSRDTCVRALENSSKEAIDFIGAFDNYLKGTFRNSASNASTNKFDILPALDLSLNRSLPSGSVNQVNDERQRLNHSDVSAFSRYVNKPLQAYNSSSPSTCNQQKDQETNSEKQFSNQAPDHNSETKFSYNHPREISLPIAVRGVRFETLSNSRVPPVYYTQSGPSPLPSPVTCHQSETFTQLNQFYHLERRNSSYQQYHNLVDQRMSYAVDQTDNNKQGQKMENLENREHHVSHVIDQSGNLSHQRHIPGSDSVVKITSECANEESREGPTRSMLREAALEKFRLKRKDRCFDKKVRYESRKKLAEQRPRVKGQFVRQVANDPQSGNSSVG